MKFKYQKERQRAWKILSGLCNQLIMQGGLSSQVRLYVNAACLERCEGSDILQFEVNLKAQEGCRVLCSFPDKAGHAFTYYTFYPNCPTLAYVTGEGQVIMGMPNEVFSWLYPRLNQILDEILDQMCVVLRSTRGIQVNRMPARSMQILSMNPLSVNFQKNIISA